MARTFDPDGGKAYSCSLYNGGEHLFLPELLACFTCISCGVEKHTMQHSQRQREIQGTDVTNGESEAMQNESDTAKRVWENVGILSFHTEQRKPQMRTLWNNRGLFHCPPPFFNRCPRVQPPKPVKFTISRIHSHILTQVSMPIRGKLNRNML